MSKNSVTITPPRGSMSARERVSCQDARRLGVLLVLGGDPAVERELDHSASPCGVVGAVEPVVRLEENPQQRPCCLRGERRRLVGQDHADRVRSCARAPFRRGRA